MNATDATSGIDYYAIKIDNGSAVRLDTNQLINGEYTLPTEEEGSHNIIVTAYDKAGNSTGASLTFLSPQISAPVLSLNSAEITKGDTVTISGKTDYPNEKIEITVQSGVAGVLGDVVGWFGSSSQSTKTYTTTTASDGTFAVTTDPMNTAGTIGISAVVIFGGGVKSQPSESVYLKVDDTKVVGTIISLIYPILGIIAIVVLLMALLFIIYFGWHKFFNLKKKMDIELQSTTKEVHKAMLLLKEELNNQLEVLEKMKSDRSLNKREEAIFNELEKNIDDIDNFIEKKLKKLL